MRLSLLTTFIFLLTYLLFGQIKIKLENTVQLKAGLFSLKGENNNFIDSLSLSDNSTFLFYLREKHPGFYRVTFNNNKWLNFIYDNEDIEIETGVNNIPDSIRIIKSESNKIYYDFIKLNKDYKNKTELLLLILARYPAQDDYYKITRDKLTGIQEDYLSFVNVTAQKNPDSFIAGYVRSAQLPAVDVDIPFDRQLDYLKTHALDNVNFYESDLIYSDAFTNKTIEYLTYYRNPQLPIELLEKEFMQAIDSILNKAKVNEIVYTHIVEYLLNGFRKFGFDNVINYIVDNYVIKDDLCLDEKLEKALDRRIRQSVNFRIGSEVPNITLPDSSGNIIELNKLNAGKTLIIFYASGCPHCQTLIPQIYDLYKNQKEKKFEVMAISVDTSGTDWLKFVKNNNLDWINVSDLKGWEGQAVLEYYIYAVPEMFLVEEGRKLVGLPKNINELKNIF